MHYKLRICFNNGSLLKATLLERKNIFSTLSKNTYSLSLHVYDFQVLEKEEKKKREWKGTFDCLGSVI